MKNEGSKKLLKEGSIDFSPAIGKVETLIFLFIVTCSCYSQVPINGFCKYQVFNVDSGYQKFLPLNYNEDSYTDLFFYNPARNTFISLDGNQNGTFGAARSYKLQLEISGIQPMWDKYSKIYAYAFISRKQSSAGILKFNAGGFPKLESRLKFNTYPENLSIGDVNGDNVPELLISGSAFDGISLIYQEQKLREKKIAEKTSFSEAVFADLNNDGYPDIAAFDMFSDKLQFLYNNSQGNFNKVREISFSTPITSLQSTDLNLDSYADLIFTYGNTIGVYYGDFTSSYDDTLTIHTRYRVDQLITGDFNRDGKIDFAYINNSEGTLSLIFARNYKEYYPELIYLRKNTLNDIIPYYSKFINGIMVLDQMGKFYLISNLASLSDGVSIIGGAYPAALSFFDKDNNSINDLCFTDEYNKTLNLITRSNSGIPETWFPIKLFEAENSIIVNNKLPGEKTFFCFTRDKKLIEVIDVDFQKNKYKRSSLYSAGGIRDLKIQESSGKLFVAYIKNKILGVTVFSRDQGSYSDYTRDGIRKNVSDAALSVYNKPEVFYSTNDDTIRIGERILQENQKNSEFETNYKTGYGINLIAGNFLNKDNSALFGFLSRDNKNELIFFLGPDGFVVSGRNTQPADLRIKDKNQLFFGQLRFNGPGKVCYFNPLQHNIKSLDLVDGNKRILRNLLLDDVNPRSFFIRNMNTREFHVVYIDDIENCITIRELK